MHEQGFNHEEELPLEHRVRIPREAVSHLHKRNQVLFNEVEEEPIVETGQVAARGPASFFGILPVAWLKLATGLAALKHPNFRILWITQLISLMGTWMQGLAQSWLVLETTGSPFALGLVSALQFLPVLLFSLAGGVVADRMPKRRLLVVTQSVQMFLAFVLAILVSTGSVQFWHILLLAFSLGTANAFDMPTRQAFVIELVGPDDLMNAVALNSAVFNAARIIGPAIGGIAIGVFGTAGAFYINGVSFIPVIIGLTQMRLFNEVHHRNLAEMSAIKSLREGLDYVMSNPLARMIIIMTALIGTFGMNFSVVVPLLARDVLHGGAQDLGFLMSAMGTGSFSAALLVIFTLKKPHIGVLLLGGAGLAVFEIALSFTASFYFSLLLLAGVGFSLVIYAAIANATLQTTSPGFLRGRVMSAYTTVFIGTTPLGNLWTGFVAESFGPQVPLLWGGLISLAVVLIGWRSSPSPPTSEAHIHHEETQ